MDSRTSLSECGVSESVAVSAHGSCRRSLGTMGYRTGKERRVASYDPVMVMYALLRAGVKEAICALERPARVKFHEVAGQVTGVGLEYPPTLLGK